MSDYVLNILVKGDGSGATQLADQVNAVGMSLDGVGKATLALAGGGLVALGAGLTSAVNAAGEFEAGMNNFASVAGSSLAAAGFSLDDVKAKALELGAVTQFSAAQAQDAMINLAKGGVPVADIMGQATDATLALAAAGGLELGPAADIVAKQLGVWGETGITAAQVADQLAQAANASTVDVDELAMGLANVAGTAKTAGVDFGDLTQTMALIAPGFSSAADAGTSLKTMIANLQPTTTAAKATFNELGLMAFNAGKAAMAFGVDISKSSDPLEEIDAAMRQYIVNTLGIQQGTDKFAKAYDEMYAKFQYSKFYDANGAFLGMENAATLLQGAVGNLSEADKVMALQTMFGSDAIRAAAAVANAGAPGFNAMGDAMTAAGTAADQSAIKQQGFAFALDSMKGTIETIQIVIGSALLPVLTSMISTITEALNGVLTFAQGILSANDPLAALVTAINTLVPGFSSFVMWIQQAAASAQPLIDMLGANLMPILAALGTVLTGAVLVALGGIIAGFLAAAAPIAALVAGLALLYAAFSSNFLGIQTIVTTVLGVVLGIVQSVGAQIVSFWTAYGAQIMAAASAAWSGLQGLISSVLQGVLSVVVAIGGQIITFWQANGASIMATVQTTWAQLGTIISGAIQIITAIITALSGVVSTVFSTIANFISQNTASIQAVLTGAWQVIQGVITAAMGIISGVIKTVLSAIQGDWRGVWEGLKTIVTSAVSGIGSILQGLGNIVRGALGVLGGIIKSVGEGLISAATAVGNNIIDGIKKGVSAGVGALKDMVKNAAKAALDAAKRALGIASPSKVFAQQVGVQIPAGMAVGITAGMPVVNKNLVDGIAGLSESAVKAITAGSQAIAAASAYHGPGGAGLSGFLAAFADLATRFNDTAVALGGRVLGTATRFADTVGKVIAPIATAVAAFASLADLVVPARATVGQFGDALALVVGNINVVASWFQQKSVDVGAKFADGAGKMLSIVGPALEAFKKLPDLVVPSRTAVGQFGGALALVVGNIAHVATWFNAQAVTAGAAFAESAGKILALIGSGVDALSKLTTFVGIPQIAVTRFGQALQQSLVVLVAIARTWAQQAVTQAATFAEGAGKIIGIIGGGVEGFLKLRDFQGVPQTAIDAFGQALNAALGVIEYVSANWIAQFVERAATFAEGAGKAISIIGGAVDGFVKLATFQGVPQGAIDAFGQALNAALVVIEYISATWIQAFVDRAATFAEGAGKAVGIIGSAVDGFLKLVTFQGVPEAAFAAFGQALTRALTVIDAMSADWASIGLDRAVAWAGAVDAIVKTITAAVDAIGKLGQLQNGAAGLLDTFSVTLNGILTEMQRQILPATTISGENMVIGLINGILSQRSALVTAMVNTVMAAVIAARQTLGIASPSKVFEQIGQYAGAGLQGGMAAMQPAVAATSAGLGISAVNATTSALRPSGGGTTNNNQRNITVNVTVGKDAGSNPYATADAVVTEINRRLGMQGT